MFILGDCTIKTTNSNSKTIYSAEADRAFSTTRLIVAKLRTKPSNESIDCFRFLKYTLKIINIFHGRGIA